MKNDSPNRNHFPDFLIPQNSNHHTAIAKRKIKEMGSRWLEKYFSKGDYQKKPSEVIEA